MSTLILEVLWSTILEESYQRTLRVRCKKWCGHSLAVQVELMWAMPVFAWSWPEVVGALPVHGGSAKLWSVK